MSYDMTIAADERFSQAVPLGPLRDFVGRLPGVQPNGERDFALSVEDRLWMEIDLESVTEEGDSRNDGEDAATVNCVRLHIPYAMLGESPRRDYFPTAEAIARYLGWSAIDDQTGEPL